MRSMKRGFTLIELLAVIVILAIIALIITPVINNIIESTRKSAYKASVEGIVDTASNYESQYMLNNLNDVKATTFTCDGVSCTNGIASLSFNGDVPKSGTITIDSNQNITVNYISNGKYCASGTKGHINVTYICSYLDTTSPVINSDYTLQSTSNSVVVTIPNGFASDSESNVVSYKIDLYNGSTLVKEDIRTDINSNITESFTGLTNSTTYNISVIAVNGNNLTTNKDKSITTGSITNPSISYTNNPTTAINGYLLSEVATVTFNGLNIATPSYYIKTTRAGISNVNTISSCGTDTVPTNCIASSATNLSSNTWYQVNGNVTITYNVPDDNTAILYGLTYDGTNYSNAVTGTISKITSSNVTVTYNGNGGTSSSTVYQYGNTLGTLPTTTRSGYTFLGWYTDPSAGTAITTSTVVSNNITYYAHWQQGYLLYFGGAANYSNYTTLYVIWNINGVSYNTNGSTTRWSLYITPGTTITCTASYGSGTSWNQYYNNSGATFSGGTGGTHSASGKANFSFTMPYGPVSITTGDSYGGAVQNINGSGTDITISYY